MHIVAFCPNCRSRYQLDPSLRGKKMRCPNTICRTVFEVREVGETTAPVPNTDEPAAKKPVVSGTVGDVVPVLAAEAVAPEIAPSVAVKESAPELIPPPVRKPPPKKGEPTRPPAPPLDPIKVPPRVPEPSFVDDLGFPGDEEESATLAPPDQPVEGGTGAWEPPPVRLRDSTGQVNKTVVPPARTSPVPEPVSPVKNSRRRSVVLILAMLVTMGAILGGGAYLISDKGTSNEAERFHKAQELYRNQDFEAAVGMLQKLLREFPSSTNRRQYDFLVELSAVREPVYAPEVENRAGALQPVLEFLAIYKNDPLLKEYHGDIWHTLQRLARALTTQAERQHDPTLLNQARRSWSEAAKFTPPAGAKLDEVTRAIVADFDRVDNMLTARAARLELLETLRELATRGSADAVRAGRALAKNAGLEKDDDVLPLLGELVKAHRAKVVFTPAKRSDKAAPAPDEELPSFYFAPQVGKGHADGKPAGIVLAQARGVLYALDGARGDVRWVRRVGVDTAVLPLRVPASQWMPEVALVLSSDRRSVAAVEAATGQLLWQHTLQEVCLGQPVLVDRHLLVPTLNGNVEEIEITGGGFQGFYALGQPLLLGGVRQPGTTLVIFPADSYAVYVLDVAQRTCAAILYTGHASGSLRGLPLVWNEAAEPETAAKDVQGWLLLQGASSGTNGLDLRPYQLPIRQPDAQPISLKVHIRGDSWTAPWCDGDKLALATDAGLLALYGIRQKSNRDELLFPLRKDDYRLDNEDRARRARALVVHADADNYWVLTAGKLHRLQTTFTAAAGPGLVERWPQPLDLGAPLHAAQTFTADDRKVTLILVTQELDRPTCWIRAVDAEHGTIRWQRRLGMVCQDQPVVTQTNLLATDAGGLVVFESARVPVSRAWHAAGTFIGNDGDNARHWSSVRGTAFVHLTWGQEPTVRIRLVDNKGSGSARTVNLPAPPLGTPALGGDFVLLPLANGILVRLALEDGSMVNGPDWRGIGVDEAQQGYVVSLDNNDFVFTDGGRSLTRIHWGEAKTWEKLGVADMTHRITAAPAVLGKQLLVADVSDTVTLLDAGNLERVRTWSAGGRISAGPYTRGTSAGVVVNKSRLLWLDPAKDRPAWEYTFVAPIVGQPELVDGLVVVADLQGGIVGLDPATGNPVGPGYRLKANEAPSAAPVAFGPGQLFVPLMDGTIMLLPVEKVR